MKKLSKYIFISVFLGIASYLLNDLFITNNLYFCGIIGLAILTYYALVAYWEREMARVIAKSIRSFVKL